MGLIDFSGMTVLANEDTGVAIKPNPPILPATLKGYSCKRALGGYPLVQISVTRPLDAWKQ
jgi:hypothetical protein